MEDPTCQWLANLGKGDVSLHFVLLSIAKIANFIEIQRLIDNKTITTDDINEAKRIFCHDN